MQKKIMILDVNCKHIITVLNETIIANLQAPCLYNWMWVNMYFHILSSGKTVNLIYCEKFNIMMIFQ